MDEFRDVKALSVHQRLRAFLIPGDEEDVLPVDVHNSVVQGDGAIDEEGDVLPVDVHTSAVQDDGAIDEEGDVLPIDVHNYAVQDDGAIDEEGDVLPIDVHNSAVQEDGAIDEEGDVLPVDVHNSAVQGDGAIDDDLIGVISHSEKEAFDIYNDYAVKIGFSVRKAKQRRRADGSISMKLYLCSHAGLKREKPNEEKSFSKLNVRTNCPALVQYDIDKDGVWIITKHVEDHNHDLCPASSSYLLRSHRRVSKTQIAYLRELQKSGVGVADSVRVLKNQSGGSLFVGFCVRDAYNALGNSKVLDGTDSNTLIEIFRDRQAKEKDFCFAFELDNDSRLCSLFWRDGRMKEDYLAFSDLLVHDTTYRTNKYDMICAPFVGMNHHGMNVMFGCGFMLNERVESFVWLFRTFLKSMDNTHPTTIMTDQCAAMSAAISIVFLLSRHRLCIWHIGDNSKKHIRSLRGQKDFLNMFNYVLKYAESVAEFEHYWMTSRFNYKSNKWLAKLYELKEKWCPAFSKSWFSGGILSSQRSESTNHSISRRLSKTAGLCAFYYCFVDVISEWRSKENAEDVRYLQGNASMVLSDTKLILHARDVYTLMVYSMFEKEFMKGVQCHQLLVGMDGPFMNYHVWVEGLDNIKHEVSFAMADNHMTCTCKLFEEVGILCCHCLRILHIHCVCVIPEFYIKKRWCKNAGNARILDGELMSGSWNSSNSTAAPLWRIQMTRKMFNLICACEDNTTARVQFEEGFDSIKHIITNLCGAVLFGEYNEATSLSSSIIQNPEGTSSKGQQNRRPKSTTEKKFNQARGGRSRSENAELHTKAAVQNLQGGKGIYVVHPASGSGTLNVPSPKTTSSFAPLRDSI